MRLSLFIAKRYLFAKKSHNVINIISIICAVGIALGTSALIIILSVYNGFGDLIKTMYGAGESDILILPAQGKSFRVDTITFDRAREMLKDHLYCEVVSEKVFAKYGSREAITEIKGVDSIYEHNSILREYIVDGSFELWHGQIPQAVAGRLLAADLGMRPHFIEPITLYFPSRYVQFSPLNPLNSINHKNLSHAGTFSAERNLDKNLLIIPISVARELLEMDEEEVSSIEIFTKNHKEAVKLIPKLKEILGDNIIIKDRYSQNETLYKMMKSEKLSIYMILLFVIVIISFNLYGSLTMLMIEKGEDTDTLKSMGANRGLLEKIFLFEGWMISSLGLAIGLIIGVLVCTLQQSAGIVKMPGNFMIDAYPIVLKWWDLLMVFVGVSAIGLLASLLPVLNFKKKFKTNATK